jgi:hypothetical protein
MRLKISSKSSILQSGRRYAAKSKKPQPFGQGSHEKNVKLAFWTVKSF